ncbi:MAG TPA: sulfurtransferase complex subunit TusD [Arenicellales bacterium]|nr:sulfurtransferase complex subunit TusD [Arenicellales bacterium]
MKFTVVVNEGPCQHQAALSAYHFTRALLEKGHSVARVFFYHDGVNNGTCLTAPPQDEPNVAKLWSRLGQAQGLDMVVCVAAAQRRGVMDEREAARHSLPAANLAPGFRIAGLGQLIDASIESDRLVVFGD